LPGPCRQKTTPNGCNIKYSPLRDHALRIDLFLHQRGLNTTTLAGKALFGMMGLFAEFERSMILGA
jgi:hypothetical protein